MTTTVERIGYVSTEGGPLLVGDLDLARSWRGAFGDGADYGRACQALETAAGARGVQIEVNGKPAIVWDMPTGIAEVWRLTANSLVLSRPWFADNVDVDLVGYQLATLPAQTQVVLGNLDLSSGWLLVMWAAEDGGDVIHIDPIDGLTLNLSVGDAGVIAALPAGRYACYHDEVGDGSSTSQRCLIVAQ